MAVEIFDCLDERGGVVYGLKFYSKSLHYPNLLFIIFIIKNVKNVLFLP